MSEPEVIVEPRNAETGQAPWQIADDPDTGRWYRFELRDGNVVFVNEAKVAMPWHGHQPPLDLRWRSIDGGPAACRVSPGRVRGVETHDG